MRDMQLIYASRPFGYDDLTLTSILMQARENNARNGITGALICREDVFLQILEGPRDLKRATNTAQTSFRSGCRGKSCAMDLFE